MIKQFTKLWLIDSSRHIFIKIQKPYPIRDLQQIKTNKSINFFFESKS